jgi:hypothetical protein
MNGWHGVSCGNSLLCMPVGTCRIHICTRLQFGHPLLSNETRTLSVRPTSFVLRKKALHHSHTYQAADAIGSLPLLRLKFSSHCKDVEGRERSRSRVRSAAARLESSIGLFSVDLGLCNYGGLIDTLFTDVEGVA